MKLRLLIGYEESAASRRALAYVAPLLQDAAIEVALLTVTQRASTHQRLYDEALDVLKQAPAYHHTMTGSLYTALLEAARTHQPDLVVYGEMGRAWSKWSRFQRRDPLYAVLPMSSLQVREKVRQIERVLLCAGGDESILHDAHFTGRLVQHRGVRATILHVLSQMPLVFGPGSTRGRVAESFAATGAPEMKHMQAAVDDLAQTGVEAEIKIRIGLVVEQVAAELSEGGYDLLVIGAHRSKGLVERFLLEDVTANILGKNLGPVLVVKRTTDH